MNASLKDELEAALELLRLVRAERDEAVAQVYAQRRVLENIAGVSVFCIRAGSKDCREWTEDMAYVGKLARGH